MMQGIVDVDLSGTHAWRRIRRLMSVGTHQGIQEKNPVTGQRIAEDDLR